MTERPSVLRLGELDGRSVVTLLADIREAAPDRAVDSVCRSSASGARVTSWPSCGPAGGCRRSRPQAVHYAPLLARLEGLLQRCEMRRGRGRLRIGRLHLDPVARDARVGETRVELSRVEFQLLLRLASEPTRVFGKAELLRDVWGYQREARTRTLDSHACRLRSMLAAAGARQHVINVWGVGYRLLDPVTTPERNGAA